MTGAFHLRDVLLGLRSQFPAALLDGQGWDRLLQRVGGLPAEAAAACGFEFRLGEPEPAADFSVVITPGPVAQHYVASGLRAPPATVESWLSRHLAHKTGRDDWIDWILLAYDLVDAPSGRQLAPAVYLSPALSRAPASGALRSQLLVDTLGRVAGRPLEDRERVSLCRALEAVPSTATVVFAAVAPDRTPRAIRLIVTGISTPRLLSFLDRLEWPGSLTTAARALAAMESVSNSVMASFDITSDGIAPRLGFEMYPSYPACPDPAGIRALVRTWITTRRSEWTRLIDRLEETGLCLPDKARGLLDWPRRHSVFAKQGAFRLHMGINHVKIVLAGECLQAKAYAGLKVFPL